MAGNGKFVVQLDELEYGIVGPQGQEGVIVEYGDTATLMIDGAMYYCHIDEPDSPGTVVVVLKVENVSEETTTVDEVKFKDDDEGDDEDDEDDDEDGEGDDDEDEEEEEVILPSDEPEPVHE